MKTLTIRDEVYTNLKRLKRKGESFSELFGRLAKKERVSITEFAGFLGEKRAEEIRSTILDSRKKTEKLDVEREKRLKRLW